MARYMRRQTQSYGHSELRAPVVIGAGIAFRGPNVLRVAVKFNNALVRRNVHSALRPPVVVNQVAVFTARPVQVRLAEPPTTRIRQRRTQYFGVRPAVVGAGVVHRPVCAKLAYSVRGRGFAIQRPPEVVNLAVEIYGPETTLAPQRRGVPKSLLSPPVVINTDRYFGPSTTLAYSVSGRPLSQLFPPAVVGAGIAFFGPSAYLAASKRGEPLSRLQPPVVVAQGGVFFGPQVTLAPQRRGTPKPQLLPPAVVGAGIVHRGIQSKLAASSRLGREPFSTVIRPIVVSPQPAALGGIGVSLAPPGRRKTISRLAPPAVINTDRYFGPSVTLVKNKPQPTITRLAPPTVVQDADAAFYGPSVTLAPQRRGTPKPQLLPPAVVGAGIVYRPVQVRLAYSRRGKPVYQLVPPTVVAEPDRYFGPKTTLAPQPKPRTLSQLLPPAVVGAGIVYRPVQVRLAYSLRGRPLSVLQPPTVVAEPDRYFGPAVTLVRIRPRPTITLLGVFPPQAVVYAPISTHLAYSVRGVTQSFLRGLPPDSERRFYGPAVYLTYSRRGKPFSQLLPVTPGKEPFRPVQTTLATNKPKPTTTELQPPVVVNAQVRAFFGPSINLTYSRRGRPLSKLRPPAVVGAGRVFRPIDVNLVTDADRIRLERVLQRKPMYFLREPQVLRLQEFDLSLRRIRKELTYSRRGRPIYFLMPPQVVRLAVEIYGPEITLAPSRFPKPQSILRPPAVVGQPPFRPILVQLAPSSRGVPKSILRAPAVVGIPPHRPIKVSLARITPQPTVARILPPAVVNQPPFRGLLVHLAPSSRGRPSYRLFPPAIVGAGIVYRAIQVHLVRITPPPITSNLRLPTDTIIERPGVVLCDDYTPYGAICDDDAQGETVTGGVSESGGTLTGGDSATQSGSTVGGTRSSGDVIGGDRRT